MTAASAGIVATIVFLWLHFQTSPELITFANCLRIEPGQTTSEVWAVLGRPKHTWSAEDAWFRDAIGEAKTIYWFEGPKGVIEVGMSDNDRVLWRRFTSE